MKTPSMKSLVTSFGEDKATKIHRLVNQLDKTTNYSDVVKWVDQCHHKPGYNERMMCAINQIVEGHGVEVVMKRDAMQPDMSYVNMGDTYTETLVLDHNKGSLKVESWGDWVERNDPQGEKYA